MADSYYSDGYDMVHAGGNTFWSCGYKYLSPNYLGVASVSTDAGASWTRHELYSGSNYGYVRAIGVDPSDTDRIFCLGYQSSAYILHYTENGGTTWLNMSPTGYTGTPYSFAVCPTNGNLLAAASSSGLYSSNDGGATWTKVTTAFGGVNDLFESDLLGGLLVATVNEGVWFWEDWTGAPVEVGSDLGHPNVKCIEESTEYIFAGTSGNSAWRSYNFVGIEEGASDPIAFTTISVSPNPSRGGYASITVALPTSQPVSIIIYDLAGRRVIMATEGIMGEGTNQLTIDTSSLASGMYFARLETENTSATARMIVTR